MLTSDFIISKYNFIALQDDYKFVNEAISPNKEASLLITLRAAHS